MKKKIILIFSLVLLASRDLVAQYDCINYNLCNLICHGGFEEAVYDGNFSQSPSNGCTNDSIWRFFTIDSQEINSIDLYRLANNGAIVGISVLGDSPLTYKVMECIFNSQDLNAAPNGQKNFVGFVGQTFNGGYSNREALTFNLHRPITVGNTYNLKFYSRKTTPNCLNYWVYIYGGNQRPCNMPTLTKIDGTVSACGYQATLIDSVFVDTSGWKLYSFNINPSANYSNILVRIKDTVAANDPSIKYGYFDNFELTRLNQKPIKILGTDTIRLCKNTGRIDYLITTDSAQTDSIRFVLSLPVGVSIDSGSDFSSAGTYTIPSGTLSSGDSLRLKLYFKVDSRIDSGIYYRILVDAISSAFCISDDSRYETQFIKVGNMPFPILATIVNPHCLSLGKVIPNPPSNRAPYTYTWDNNYLGNLRVEHNKDNLEIRPNWIYELNITDRFGCTSIERYNLPLENPTNLDAYVSSRMNCELNNTTMTVIPISGTGSYTYLWDNGSTNPVRVINSAGGGGTYTVTVTETSTGCSLPVVENANISSYLPAGDNWGYIYPLPTITGGKKRKIHLDGKAYIDADFDLRYSDILMEPGSEIIVYSGVDYTYNRIDSIVRFYQNNIYTCGNYLAKGITVLYMSGRFVFDKNQLRDCSEGVKINNTVNNNNVSIKDNLFENNQIGLHLLGGINNTYTIYGNTFQGIYGNPIKNAAGATTGYGYVKNYYSGMPIDTSYPKQIRMPATSSSLYASRVCWAGIVAENAPNLFIGDYMKGRNYFTNLYNGVMLYGSNATITNSKFYNDDNVYHYTYHTYGINPPVLYGAAVYGLMNTKTKKGSLDFTGLGILSNSEQTISGYSYGLFADGYNVSSYRLAKLNRVFYGIGYKSHTILGLSKNLNVADNIIVNDDDMDLAPVGIGAFDYGVDNTSFFINNNKIYHTSFGIIAGKLTNIANRSSVTIKNNYVEGIPNRLVSGIRVENFPNISTSPYLNVNGNSIKFTTTTISGKDGDYDGIEYTNSSYIQDKMNTVVANSPNIYSPVSHAPRIYPIGIHYENSTGNFSCNILNNIYTGTRFFGNCSVSNWSKNKLNNHNTGLRIAPNTTLQNQKYAGNTFKGTCVTEARTDQSKYTLFYFSNSDTNYAPNPAFPMASYWWWYASPPSTGIENDVCSNSIVFWGSGSGSGIPIGNRGDIIKRLVDGSGFSPVGKSGDMIYGLALTTVDTSLLTNNVIFGSFEPELTWQYRQELYNKMKPFEEEYRDTSIFREYLAQIEEGTINEFTEINSIPHVAYLEADTKAAQIQALEDGLAADQLAMRILDSAIFVQSDSATLAGLREQRDQLQMSIYHRDSLFDSLVTGIGARYINSLQEIQALNDSIIPEGRADSLLRIFNAVYYQTYGIGNAEISSEQYAVYTYLAAHCPFENLDVVYRSRGVVHTYNDTIRYADSLLCAQIGITVKSSRPIAYTPMIQKPIEYKVYPNPAREHIRVLISEIPKFPILFIIEDILGRKVYEENTLLNSNQYTIPTDNWNNGIYFLRLINGKETLYQTKIEIRK